MPAYDPSLEILADLYIEYRKHSAESADTIHRIGRTYLPLIDEYGLDGKNADAIRLLSEYETDGELETAHTRILRAYLELKRIVRKEQEEYNEFCMHFSGATRQALLRLPEYVSGRTIPYRLKDHCLHIDLLNIASMNLSLDFDDVLIEDGRSPREIIMERIRAEKIVQERRVRMSDGTEQIMQLPAYRFSFINRLGRRRYPLRVSSFTCTDVNGNLTLYDYTGYPGDMPSETDKLAYRRLYYLLDSFILKSRCLGRDGLNEEEIRNIPLFTLFHELVGFYLDPGTRTAAGVSLISYDRKLAQSLVISQDDIDEACALLRPHGFKNLVSQMEKFSNGRDEFLRFWIRYASTRQSSHLYGYLMERLSRCSGTYRRHPLSLPYRKYHSFLRRLFDSQLCSKGWSGSFPCYYMEKDPEHINIPNIYTKQYKSRNRKRKSYYVDFMESVTDDSYTIMSLRGEILLRDGEEASEFCALDGCFADGSRRSNRVFSTLTISADDDAKQIPDAAARMARSITDSVRGEV